MKWVHILSNKINDWSIMHLPAAIVARPFECLIALLCFNSGVNILIGQSTPQSAEVVLRSGFYYGWATSLVVGAVAMAWGLASIRWIERPVSYIMNNVVPYQFGMRLLALAAFVFGGAILINGGWNGLPAASVTILFGSLCLARLVSLRSRI
jgi:hypothetical protein